jgi:methyl-accepting chemotaxis protein
MSINEIADHTRGRGGADERLERAARSLPRRRFFSDMPDKGLFGIAAVGGFAAICGLKLQGHDADLIACLAVAAMIGYGFLAYQMPLVQMRLDRLGDNFYYLGFIYTLASLSAALLQMRVDMNILPLIGSFGIALVTTIVGIAGRVLFVQLRSEIDDIEDRVRRDLAACSADLRAQLASSVREFETVRTSLLQTLSETVIACDNATKRQVERVDELTKRAADQISIAFADQRREAEKIGGLVTNIATVVHEASQRVATIELPSERLNQQLGNFTQELEKQLRRLGATIDDVARSAVPQLGNFTQELETLLQRLGTRIDDIAHRPQRRWAWPFRRSG